MPNLNRIVSQLLTLMVLLGCAPVTKISSSKNPTIQGKTFQKILVEARGPNPQENIQIEWAFRSLFDQVRLPFVPATELFPADDRLPDTNRQELIRRQGIDGILLVHVKDIRRDTIYHPPTTTNTEVRKRKDGSTYIVTTQSGDYTEHVMNQEYGLTLLDTADFKPAWVGSANTRGDFKSNEEKSFFRSLAKQTLKDLSQAGLIRLGAPLPK